MNSVEMKRTSTLAPKGGLAPRKGKSTDDRPKGNKSLEPKKTDFMDLPDMNLDS